MPSKKISQLTAAGPLVGTEPLPIVQGGVTVKTTVEDVFSFGGSPIFTPRNIYFGGTTCADVNIIDDYSINSLTSESITAPNLLSIDGQIYLSGGSNGLKTISMPLLQTISVWAVANIPGWAETSIYIFFWNSLETIDFGSLTIAKDDVQISSNSSLNSLDISSLEEIGGGSFDIYNNSSLTTLDISSLTTFDGGVNMFNNAFTQATVDGILNQLANVVVLANQNVDLSGGTNAAPSVTGATYVATLVGNGCTVTTN
jgi:hypothetical protein